MFGGYLCAQHGEENSKTAPACQEKHGFKPESLEPEHLHADPNVVDPSRGIFSLLLHLLEFGLLDDGKEIFRDAARPVQNETSTSLT